MHTSLQATLLQATPSCYWQENKQKLNCCCLKAIRSLQFHFYHMPMSFEKKNISAHSEKCAKNKFVCYEINTLVKVFISLLVIENEKEKEITEKRHKKTHI